MSPYVIVQVIQTLFNFYSTLVLVYCLLSWFPIRAGGLMADIASVIASLVEPYINLFRRFIPPLGGIDFSPVIAILALTAIERVVVGILI